MYKPSTQIKYAPNLLTINLLTMTTTTNTYMLGITGDPTPNRVRDYSYVRRKLSEKTGLTPNQLLFTRKLRYSEVAEFLNSNNDNVSVSQ